MELRLPQGYYLELSADICVLKRDAIVEAAWEDYRPPTLRQRETK